MNVILVLIETWCMLSSKSWHFMETTWNNYKNKVNEQTKKVQNLVSSAKRGNKENMKTQN